MNFLHQFKLLLNLFYLTEDDFGTYRHWRDAEIKADIYFGSEKDKL